MKTTIRDYSIDRLRIFLTMLVIFHHSAIAFGASGGWYYTSPVTTSGTTQLLLSAQMAINQAYFMSLFFFISAVFMPASLDRKGFRKFMSDRLIRLGIPLLVYIFVIHPALCFLIDRHTGHTGLGWFAYWKIIMTKHAEPGPMWFVLTLLLFETAYACYRRFCPGSVSSRLPAKKPSGVAVVLFMITAGLLAFAFRLVYPTGTNFFGLQFGYFPLYLLMYPAGILAARKNWLGQFRMREAWFWFTLSLVAIPALLLTMRAHADDLGPFSGGFNPQALFYAMWEPVVCIGFSYFLLVFVRKHWNGPNRLVLTLSADSYAAYIIHPVVVVIATMWSESMVAEPLLKLAFVLVTSIPLSFGISHLLRKIPGFNRVI
jgi:glucan biosynthesis protein C